MTKGRLAGFLALFLCLSACAAPPVAEYSQQIPQEKRLTVYTAHKQAVYGPILKEFEERTGIWVELVTGGTGALLERISAEAEDPRCDIMFGGGVESLVTCEDYFAPYSGPDEEKLKGITSEKKLWTPFSSLPLVLIYNKKLVAEGDLTGWRDLLDPRWRGKIALADPNISGSGYTAVLTLLSCLPGDDWQLLARLVSNLDGGVLSDSGDVVEQVADGTLQIGATLEETALKGIAAGADLGIVYPEEGTSAVPDGSALILNAPHPENAKKFLDFIQGEDVQRLVVTQFARRSVRTDMQLPPELPAQAQLRLIDYDVYWAAGLKEEFTRRWVALIKGATP